MIQPPYDVFLSYSRTDEIIADEFIRLCSSKGLVVWYDKYIQGGKDWRSTIVDALSSSSTLVILFSASSNNSNQLIKEIAIADKLGKLVIPVLIQDVEPTGAYLFEMASRNWISLYPDPVLHLGSLVDTLIQQVRAEGRTGSTSPDPASLGSPPTPTPTPTPPGPPAESILDNAPAPGETLSRPPISEASVVALPDVPKQSWFPLRRYDPFVLAPILVGFFVLDASRRSPENNAGSGFNFFAILIYLLILALRNARMNKGVLSWQSFAGYFIVSLLIAPFCVLPDWIENQAKTGYVGLAFGLVLLSFFAAALTHVVIVVVRTILLRKRFRSKIKDALSSQASAGG